MEWREIQMYSDWRTCIETVGHKCHNVIPLESLRKQLQSLKLLQEDLLQYFTPSSMIGQSSQPLPHSITKHSHSNSLDGPPRIFSELWMQETVIS